MVVPLELAPHELVRKLKLANPVLSSRCYENCVIAVVGFAEIWRLEYVLGFVKPPGYGTYAHAWLLEQRDDGPVYFDPTLQDSSLLWSQRRTEFVYDERYRFGRDELLSWIRGQNPERTVGKLGLPDGAIRGPIINPDGIVE
ncbi:hypothetical protein [Burkholderia vietnamiensis]|uniref:hypothetical protein n=1 Tax=Burkholderia vietnamiensis TaxID=60552 RepID=UPI000A6559FE|nr:hypothetical protein [Burkholderia vietnamiensis]